jgi:Domain of unknown function (DUF4384)
MKPIQQPVLFALALLLLAVALRAQTADDEARGAFIKNRNRPASPPQPPQPPAGVRRKPPRRPSPAPAPAPDIAAPVRIGLGLTLYQRNERGEAVRVHPTKTFQKDDSVRFVIEPNLDGYLYIFHSEGEGAPAMIFPDHRLHDGENKVLAHVPYEVPSRHSRTPWFVFDERPAVETLWIVVSRTPLPGVPAGAELVKHCLPMGDDCIWKPATPQADRIAREAEQPKIVSLHQSLGQVQAAAEAVAIAKGIKLKSQEPEPTIVQLNLSAALDLLVMKTHLIHQ